MGRFSRSTIIRRGLLVVFLIVLGLAAISTPTGNFDRAKKMSALATARLLESSIDSYFNDSGSMPDVESRVTTHSAEGLKLLTILLGLDANSVSAPTTRVLEFRTAKEGKINKNGIIYAPDRKSVEGLYDPWGSSYTIILDTENKQELHFTLGSKSIDLKGRRSAAFSPGPDKQIGTSDDVVTW